jgi:hypothetical protein
MASGLSVGSGVGHRAPSLRHGDLDSTRSLTTKCCRHMDTILSTDLLCVMIVY